MRYRALFLDILFGRLLRVGQAEVLVNAVPECGIVLLRHYNYNVKTANLRLPLDDTALGHLAYCMSGHPRVDSYSQLTGDRLPPFECTSPPLRA